MWLRRCVAGAPAEVAPCVAHMPVRCPFYSLEDSKHAYYLVFDVEIAFTDKFGNSTARALVPQYQARYLGTCNTAKAHNEA